MKKPLWMIACASLVAGSITGCKTEELLPAPPKEYIHVPLQLVAGAIPGGSQEKIMSNPNLRAYAVGRYVDPHKRVMHEQHSVYRGEKLPEWNLIPQPDADPVLQAQKMRQERYADAATGQIERAAAEIHEMRQTVLMLLESRDVQKQQADTLLRNFETLKKQYGVLSGNMVKTSEFVNSLEGELKKLKQENEVLKLQQKKRELPAACPPEVRQ